ncbi:hypothetical protein PRIPAC_83755 [Pristionchus pacificus]|uniref:Uncharacterized protein n=1 Tax=Pristionchus pacificus TaxID=54126 RepID=A0A2A6BH61_PRIPA|nr:hypothetical protein PRIPAC_83755 [Pristionchus pacificus]|eukprot:PDM65161.1 hypothetical protein PRIPAC_53410 [Pristionchus pacificus]
MSYALIKQNGVYTITDFTLLIGGAYTRGYTVQVRNESDELEDAIFIGMGREREMMELKESEEAAWNPKGRGRKRGAPKPLFTLHSPHRGNPTVLPEEEDNQSGVEEIDETTTRSLRPRRSTRSRDPSPHIDLSRDSSPALAVPSAPPPSSIPFDPQWLLDSIRSIVREEVKSIVREEEKEVKKRLDSIVDYINRREGRELTQRNCVEKIAQTLVSNESQHDHVEKKLDDLSTLVDKAIKHLPSAPSEFNYDQFGMCEPEVANCESDLPSFVVFAARLADKLFPDQLSLPFKRRDPARILWLTQCLIRRRKWSLGNDITQNMSQVRNRIDTNARNYVKRIAQGRTAVDRMPKHNIRDVGGKFAPRKRPIQKATVPSTSSSAPSYPPYSSFMIRPNSSQGFAQSRHTYPTSHQLDHDTPTTSRSIVNQYSHNPPNYDARVSRNPLPQQAYVPRSLFSHRNSIAPVRADYGRMESTSPHDVPYLYDHNELDDRDYRDETEYTNNNSLFDDEWEEEIGESLYSESTYQIKRRV